MTQKNHKIFLTHSVRSNSSDQSPPTIYHTNNNKHYQNQPRYRKNTQIHTYTHKKKKTKINHHTFTQNGNKINTIDGGYHIINTILMCDAVL